MRPTEATAPSAATRVSGQNLRNALRMNAAFSAVTGVGLVVSGPWLAGPIGVHPVLLPVVGVGLLVFAARLLLVAAAPGDAVTRAVGGILAADAAWVVGALVVIAAGSLTSLGAIALGAVTLVVGMIASWQTAALHRAAPDAEGLEVVTVTGHIAAPSDAVWEVITDHELYGRLAPNLSAVKVVSGDSEPLRRECANTSGNTWQETCTLWEEGRRFAVEVDTSDYPYPLAVMRGMWEATPAADGTDVLLRFSYRARRGLRAAVFAAIFSLLAKPISRRIIRGWEEQLAPKRTTRRSAQTA